MIAARVSGPMRVHWVPLLHWEKLPFPRGIEVTGAVELLAGCDYTLTIENDISLDRHGSCLAEAVTIPLRVWRNRAEAVAPEIDTVLYSPVNGDVAALRLSGEARVSAERLFERYRGVFGLRSELDSLREDPKEALPALPELPDSTRVFYQQHFRGYPVFGHGYAVTLDGDDRVLSVIGGFRPLMQLASEDVAVPAAEARWIAAAALQLSAAELINDGLVIVTGDATSPRAPELAWRFRDSEDAHVLAGVSAMDGSILFQPAVFGFGGSAPLDGVSYNGEERLENVDTQWHGTRLVSLSLLSSEDDPEAPFYSFVGTAPGVRTRSVTQAEVGGELAPAFRTATTRGLPGGLSDPDALV